MKEPSGRSAIERGPGLALLLGACLPFWLLGERGLALGAARPSVLVRSRAAGAAVGKRPLRPAKGAKSKRPPSLFPPLRALEPQPLQLDHFADVFAELGELDEPPPAALTAPTDGAGLSAADQVLLATPLFGRTVSGARSPAGEAAVSCRPDLQSREPRVLCTDGKVWTMRAAGLILPPVLRCSTELPECCQIGYRSTTEFQLADLLRVGEGQSPVCHMRVQDFLTNAPSRPATSAIDDELPPGLRATNRSDCARGLYPTSAGCQDPRLLVRLIQPTDLRDVNRPLVPEARAVVARLRREFDKSGQCPQSALDVEVLQRIAGAAQLRAELSGDSPLDVTPLIARALSPGRAKSEPGLPVSCGYNAASRSFFQTTFHCVQANSCFAQSQESLAHTCVRFERAATAAGGSPYFWPTANCQGVPSCLTTSASPCTGVIRLTALGDGVFLQIQEDPSGLPFYYGVLFARRPVRSAAAAKAARRARELLLDMGKSLESPDEQAKLRALIESLPPE